MYAQLIRQLENLIKGYRIIRRHPKSISSWENYARTRKRTQIILFT